MKKKKSLSKATYTQVANFLFEVGILAHTPRSGFHFLGSGNQSVAEHINRVCYIAYVLAHMDGTVDVSKVLEMALLHDISETRISDLNYVHQKYTERKEHEAHRDIAQSVPFGEHMFETISEYEKRVSPESIIVKDADNLEWILSLKEQVDAGNTRALTWITSALKRLKTTHAQKLGKVIMSIDSNDWWGKDRETNPWFVDRTK